MVKIYKEQDTIYMEDNGDIVDLTNHIMVDKKTGRDVIKLPENSANRQWIMVDKVTEEGVELNYKETRTIGPRGSKKDWREYLTEDERFELDQYEEGIARLKAIADENRRAEKETPMTAEEKLRAKIAKLQAQLDTLNKEEVDE
jgi:hypothetical protein